MKDWKHCMIWGDMSADSAADQYPEVNVCGSCIAEDNQRGEDAQIVNVLGPYDSDYGSDCGLGCGECADDYEDDEDDEEE